MSTTSLVRRTRRPGPLVAISMAYLLLVSTLMLWRGISASPDYLLVVMVPIALLSGRFLGYLRDWVPFVALFLGYEAMRGLATKTGFTAHESDMADIENTLFAGHMPAQLLQSTLGVPRWLTIGCTVVYFCHFIFPLAVGMALWLVNRAQFLRYVTTLIAMSFAAFVIFLLVPTAPPWMANEDGVLPGVAKLISDALPSGISPYYQSLNPNRVAAFPSLHAAYPFLGALALWPINRRASLVATCWCVVVWFSVVYLGEHYVIDVIGGVTLAVASWFALAKLVVPRVPALRYAYGDDRVVKRRAPALATPAAEDQRAVA